MRPNVILTSLALVSLTFLAPSCSKEPEDKFYTHVSQQDASMNQAIEKARAETPRFLAALRNPAAGQRGFSVKKPYPTRDRGMEHMWISDVTFVDGELRGIIANDAVETDKVKLGDAVSLKPAEISDWYYVEQGRLVGGYTIRYFYDRATPDEKKEMEAQTGFKFE